MGWIWVAPRGRFRVRGITIIDHVCFHARDIVDGVTVVVVVNHAARSPA